MSHVLRVGVADQIAYFRAFEDDGTAKTDLTSATTGLSLSVFRVGLAAVSISSLSDKAADNTTHADGAIRQVAGNLYTVDLPDAATADQTPSVGVKGTYTGGVIEPVPHPIVNYDPAVAAVGANVVTPDNTAIAAIDSRLPASPAAVSDLADIKGATFDTATDSLEAIREAVDAGGVVNVLPAVGIIADRSPGATLTPVVGETISQSITLYATDGTTPINLSGKTLAIVFETLQGVDVAVVASGSITISGADSNVVSFAYPSDVTASERTLRFAIRDAAAPLTMYLQGLCIVTRAPQVD